MVFHVSAFCPLVSVTIRYCEPALGPRRDRSGERGHGRGALRIYKGRETFRVGIHCLKRSADLYLRRCLKIAGNDRTCLDNLVI